MVLAIAVRQEFWKDGVLTEPDSAMTLSDVTATYGIRKAGGENVIAAGTAMTKLEDGIYQYVFTVANGAEYNQAYTAWVKIIHEDRDFHIEQDIAARVQQDAGSLTALKVTIADFLSWQRNSEGAGSDWSTDEVNRLNEIVEAGARRVYYPQVLTPGGRSHQWSFLYPHATLTTTLPYSTGTVSSSGTTVTLSGGTFAAWSTFADQADIVVDGEHYKVASYTDTTHLELERTPGTAFSADSYSLERYIYDLPSDFDGLRGEMTFHPDHAQGYRPVTRVSVQKIRELRRASTVTNYPQSCAVRPATFATATGQRWEVLFHPTSMAANLFEYRYKVQATVTVDSDTYFRGGPMVFAAIEASCLAIAEQRFKENGTGEQTELFRETLAAAIEADAEESSLPYLGADEGGELSDGSSRRILIPVITIDGVVM